MPRRYTIRPNAAAPRSTVGDALQSGDARLFGGGRLGDCRDVSSARRFGVRRRRRRGAIFITALGIIVILAGLVLVLAQEMRTEVVTSANQLAYIEADAVERGAEQWVMSQTDSYPGDALSITQVPAAAIQVGDGYFWILTPDQNTDTQYDFGITDESSKLNINAGGVNRFALLPGVDQNTAGSIINWRSSTSSNSDGATNEYYESLPEPYQCKNANFETVEELLLVSGVTPQMLWGYDANRNGVIDEGESASIGVTSLFSNSGGGSRGIFPCLTAYTLSPNRKTNIKNSNQSQMVKLMQKHGVNPTGGEIAVLRAAYSVGKKGGPPTGFSSMTNFYTLMNAGGLQPADMAKLFDYITASNKPVRTGLINLNTASATVLVCLGLSQSQASALVSQQSTATTTDHSWAFKALGSALSTTGILDRATFRSYQYSADIVAVSGDGRAFKRVRIVVDCTQVPSKVVYRHDLTSLGWPLTPELRQSMRAGHGITPDMQSAGTIGSGLTSGSGLSNSPR